MKSASAEALLIRRGGVRVPRGFWVNGPLMGGLDASRSIDAFVRKAVLFSQHQLALALAQVGLSEWGHESSVDVEVKGQMWLLPSSGSGFSDL